MTIAEGDLALMGILEIAKKISSRELSPVEITEAFLDRIERSRTGLSAFISTHPDQALAVATASESMIKAGYTLGPLHGVPIAIKDNISLSGRKTSAGSKILADYIPSEDSTIVSRLKRAGANIIANTNMHEFAWGATSENPHYGKVKNPWDTNRTPFGSSGGSASAVAAGLIPGAFGTDTGGSVRLPSSATGITGIRPTIGRVSNHGIIPLAWSLDTCGPMTHSAEDNALLLQIVAGHDRRDSTTATVAVPDYLRTLNNGVQGLRIGVVPDYAFTQLQPAVLAATKKALAQLCDLGAIVQEIDIPELEYNISALMTIETAESTAYHQRWLRERPEDYGDDVRFMLEQGELYLASHYIQAQRYRSLLRDIFINHFNDSIDVFVFPTTPFTAPMIGTETIELETGVEQATLQAIMRYTGIASLTGLPALSVPSGFDHNTLPIGMQLIGKPFGEATLFKVAHAFQKNSSYHIRTPTSR
ncbi:amidase [Cryobacterium sp. Y57]|uniref:amidase n=1 Tax=Cryobacterium sp. Y57 TaxID=2048287 RepID=UPI0018EB5532|nr:amidase [Cryobacterium sp. Y57]